MYSDIFMRLPRPELYRKNEINFWNDEHISKYMLEAHLNPDYEGASRKLKFIDDSVKWIQELMSPSDYPRLLDVGCGPGLYAERFFKAGYGVTGIDFSKRSIEHAKGSAKKKELDIDYIYKDYLEMDFNNVFDLVTFIYCDYGALSSQNRKVILKKIYKSLKKGGKFILDVFSMVKYNEFEELNIWNVYENGGFWSEEKYLLLNSQYKYLDNVTLEQSIVITCSEIKEYCIWNCCFNSQMLIKELNKAGFEKFEIFGDVTGKKYTEDSPTIAIILEK